MTTRPSPIVADDSRYRLLVEAVSDYAIYMLDPEGAIASWNPGAARIKGYAADEVIGRHFSIFYPEAERLAGVPTRALQTAAGGGRFEAEGWRIRRDGSPFWAYVVIDPIRGPDGALIGFAKVTRDLTDRREAELARRRSEEHFRLLVQSVTDYAIYLLDPDGRVTNWNAGAQRIKGYRADEIVGSHFSRFYSDEDRAAGLPERGLAEARLTGSFRAEGWRVRRDGSRFWAMVAIDAIRDDGGTLIGFAKVTRDRTEKREADLALERTREALVQAQKLEALGQLTGGIAHDFNNLLTPIVGSLDLLRRRHRDDALSQRQIGAALEASDRARTLVQRLLTFARRQLLDVRPVDVALLVERLTDLILRSLGPGISLVVDAPPGLPAAQVDPNQLELAILNLAVNARDAMPAGGTVTVSVRHDAIGPGHPLDLAPGDYLRLSVIDTGLGMDAKTLASSVEPFYTTKGPGRGTGLGLSMVHGLAAQSGGRLVLSSTPGVGTRAEIWLPATDREPASMPPSSDAIAAAPASAAILLVDDEDLVRQGTAEMLRDLGYVVIEAGSGAQALDLVRAGLTPDILVSDYMMPGMTGLDLGDRLRRLLPALPMLLITGYASPAGRADEALGKVAKLAKPFRQAEISRRLAELLGDAAAVPGAE